MDEIVDRAGLGDREYRGPPRDRLERGEKPCDRRLALGKIVALAGEQGSDNHDPGLRRGYVRLGPRNARGDGLLLPLCTLRRVAFFGGGAHTGSPGTSAVAGKCPTTGTTGQVKLGSWRTWGGTALPTIPTSVIQPVEAPYLWPLFLPYNMNSKGVVNSTTGPVYVSDTLRGFITFYESTAGKDVVIIDDLVYDQDPTQATALCRNFLGIIAGQNVYTADNGLNMPRVDYAGTVRW